MDKEQRIKDILDEVQYELTHGACIVDKDRVASQINALFPQGDDVKCGICGGLVSKNPHNDAGKPDSILSVGAEYECIPCVVRAMHAWSGRARKAESELANVPQGDESGLLTDEEIDKEHNNWCMRRGKENLKISWRRWIAKAQRDLDLRKRLDRPELRRKIKSALSFLDGSEPAEDQPNFSGDLADQILVDIPDRDAEYELKVKEAVRDTVDFYEEGHRLMIKNKDAEHQQKIAEIYKKLHDIMKESGDLRTLERNLVEFLGDKGR